MQITLNGKPDDVPERVTVAEFLDERGMGGAACAVEVNKVLVPKKQHAHHVLRDGDTVEVVTLVGGG